MNRTHARRRFVLGAAAGAGAGAAVLGYRSGVLAPYGSGESRFGKRADEVTVHGRTMVETRREAIGSTIVTPGSKLFVCSNLPVPDASIATRPDEWTIAVEGVRKPRSLSVRELRKIGVRTVATVLQCAGNGRAFFDHEPSGPAWSTGAAGCVLWSGVPVKALVEALGGVNEGVRYLTGTGGEPVPTFLDADADRVERSVPTRAVERAILAWEMNGTALPLVHGGPLRLVVPGYFGVNNVKYVKRLAFTEEESPTRIQQVRYRLRPVGLAGGPDQPTTWEMPAKSWITATLGDAATGHVQVRGVAMGGTRALDCVEISADDGDSWSVARCLGPDLGECAWRPFVLDLALGRGTHRLASRATTVDGIRQPALVAPNHGGYGHDGWRDHAVEVTLS